MGVLEDGELVSDHGDGSDGDRIQALGNVLFGVAAGASGSDSSDGGSAETDNQARKKRKRSA